MQYFYVSIITIFAVGLGVTAVALMTRLKFPTAWIRKLSHLGSMALIIIVALLFGYKLFIIVGIVCAVLLLLIKLIHPPKALKGSEARASYGEIFFFIGITLTALLANSTLHFIIPVAILGLADTAAYIVGRSVKSRQLLFSKTLAGSLAFVVVAFFLFLLAAPWQLALLGAYITGLAELVGLRGSDNISVPAVAALLLTLA